MITRHEFETLKSLRIERLEDEISALQAESDEWERQADELLQRVDEIHEQIEALKADIEQAKNDRWEDVLADYAEYKREEMRDMALERQYEGQR